MNEYEQILSWVEHAAPQIKKKRNFVCSLKITHQKDVVMQNGYVVGRIKDGTFVPNERAHMDFMFDPTIN